MTLPWLPTLKLPCQWYLSAERADEYTHSLNMSVDWFKNSGNSICILIPSFPFYTNIDSCFYVKFNITMEIKHCFILSPFDDQKINKISFWYTQAHSSAVIEPSFLAYIPWHFLSPKLTRFRLPIPPKVSHPFTPSYLTIGILLSVLLILLFYCYWYCCQVSWKSLFNKMYCCYYYYIVLATWK